MIDEHKFPFKWMQKIINTFIMNDKPFTSFQIARKVGSCSSDAGEVIKMLAFLTQYGQVVSNCGKWKIEQNYDNQEVISKGFRVHYIRELTLLLQNLSEHYVKTEDLARKIKKNESEILDYLNFLSLITEKGQVYLHKNRFPQQWGFRSWVDLSYIQE